jgi:hypothetical protein
MQTRICCLKIESKLPQRHCERSEAIDSFFALSQWIASRSLSSGAHSRDPVARNDVDRPIRMAINRAGDDDRGVGQNVQTSLRAQRSNPSFFLCVETWIASLRLAMTALIGLLLGCLTFESENKGGGCGYRLRQHLEHKLHRHQHRIVAARQSTLG